MSLEVLIYRGKTAASITIAALFWEAEKRAGVGAPPVGMEYRDLAKYVAALDKGGFGRLLAESSQPEHLLRMWTNKAVADGWLERVENARYARFMLTPAGRRAARLAPLPRAE